jgi:hypothetical protein
MAIAREQELRLHSSNDPEGVDFCAFVAKA